MTFSTAISGLRAADSDLSIIGNNIANASTTGFKQSRGEFVDVFASAALGSGGNNVGSGVALAQVSQQFRQGNISFTNNSLDLAINGNGFFIVDDNGAVEYTRNGIFGVDQDGVVVNSSGKEVQGFPANASGEISGELSSLTISNDEIAPRQTTEVTAALNLDASELPPEERGSLVTTSGANIGVAQAAATNGYGVETLTFTLSDGTTRTVTTVANASAETTSSAINALPEVSSTASTTATLSNINSNSGTVQISLNGVTLVTSAAPGDINPQDVAIAINALTNTTLRGISATFTGVGPAGTVTVTSNQGDDLSFQINNTTDAADTLTVTGPTGAAVALDGNNTGALGFNATVGGAVTVTLENTATMTTDGAGLVLFSDPLVLAPFVNNSFDPDDQDTYNHATSLNVFDSLGNSHVMTMFFVKENTGSLNQWSMYLQIDGEDIGDPDPAASPPNDTVARRARYTLVFDSDGTLDTGSSDPVQITYWNPVDGDGNPNGALTGTTVAAGATFPLTEPYTSSNFVMDIGSITQFGSDFAVNDLNQDGYTTGRLTDVNISPEGIIFSRYTNGQSRTLGQIALANFRNQQGLQPNGETSWVETFTSGNAVVGTPGSASLGVVQSGATEGSNVELSNELVRLIEAQRNFQANAKTIQTADATTQSIINIR